MKRRSEPNCCLGKDTRMPRIRLSMLSAILVSTMACFMVSYGQRTDILGPEVRKYVSVGTRKTILEHVEIIDGTGAPSMADRNITIEEGKISAISEGRDEQQHDGTTIL